MGFEPTTSGLGSRHSTAELHPLATLNYDRRVMTAMRLDGSDSVGSSSAMAANR